HSNTRAVRARERREARARHRPNWLRARRLALDQGRGDRLADPRLLRREEADLRARLHLRRRGALGPAHPRRLGDPIRRLQRRAGVALNVPTSYGDTRTLRKPDCTNAPVAPLVQLALIST